MKSSGGKTLLIYFLVSLCVVGGIVFMLTSMSKKSDDTKYSEVMEQFDKLNVSEFTLDLGSGELKYRLKTEDKNSNMHTYRVPNVSLFASEILGEENDNNYRKRYDAQNKDDPLKYDLMPISDNSFILNLIPTLLMLGVMIFFFVFMMKSANGGKMSSFGKSNARVSANSKKATFADVAGADEEKEELQEIVDFLRDNKKYVEIGARIPKGVLLEGPPGTGKTLLARAVAGEAKVPFFSISGSDFVEMDGFEDNTSVIVMAATNRRDILDPALLRPGRFDRHIVVGRPDVKGREEILKVHTRKKPLAPDVDLKVIAKTTVGFTGADLENLVNEASLLAARNNRKAITEADIEEASLKVVMGPEKKSRIVTEKEKKLTAYHESGHALCHYYCKTQDDVHYVTIIPRGQAGGFTMSRPEKDDSYVSKNQMAESIIVLLGGRVAEKLILDDISTGASNDLERATYTARAMVTRYGFSDNLGPIVYGRGDHEVFLGRDYSATPDYSDAVAAEIDHEIRTVVEDAFEKCEAILKEHIDKLHELAGYLMEHEKIDGETFKKLMEGNLIVDSDVNNAEDIKPESESVEESED